MTLTALKEVRCNWMNDSFDNIWFTALQSRCPRMKATERVCFDVAYIAYLCCLWLCRNILCDWSFGSRCRFYWRRIFTGAVYSFRHRRHINVSVTFCAVLQRAQLHCKRCISYGNSVRPSVCLSHAGIVSKRRHVARCSFHRWIAKCV